MRTALPSTYRRRRIVIATTLAMALTGCGGSTSSSEAEPTEGTARTPAVESTPTPATSLEPTPTAPATPGPPLVQTSGSGDSVERFDAHDTPSVAAFTHAGDANFAVLSYIGTDRDDLLINAIGAYAGNVYVNPGVTMFEITANGDWSVDAKPLTEAETWDGSAPYNGTGDNVLILPAAALKSMRIVATGESNIAILAYGIDGERLDLLVNEIGAYTGDVLLPDADPLVLAVQGNEMEWVLAPPEG